MFLMPSSLVALGGQPPRPANAETTEVQAQAALDAVIKQYQAIKQLPGLSIRYRIDNQRTDRASKFFWAYPWAEYEQKVTFTRPQIYSLTRLPLYYTDQPPKKGQKEQVKSTDGEYFLQMNSSSISAAGLSPLTETCINTLRTDLQYFLFLGYALYPETDLTQAHRLSYSPDNYWLPSALEKHRKEYQVRPAREIVQGVPCLVFERKGVDVLWVQTSPHTLIRKRQIYYKDQQPREIFEFGEFREVSSDIRLPTSITSKRFEPNKPNDSYKFELTLKVLSLECNAIPLGEFRPTVPIGAEVQDHITNADGVHYINQPGKNPFTQSIEDQVSRRRYLWLAAEVAGGLAIVTIFLLWRRRRSKRLTHHSVP